MNANGNKNPLPKSEGQAVLGRQSTASTPWLTERHGYDPTYTYVGNSLIPFSRGENGTIEISTYERKRK